MLAGPSSSLSTTTTNNTTRSFTDVVPASFPSLATPMASPSPAAVRSKTNAFFSSSFSTPGPALSRPAKEQHSPKPKSLTAAFFGSPSTPTPTPPTSPPKKPSRNFLNLDLSGPQLSVPVTSNFASTPSPSTSESGRQLGSAPSEPTPRPAYSSVKVAAEESTSNIADILGTEPDAEVLSTINSSLSKLSASSQAYIASHIPSSPSPYPHQFVPSMGEQTHLYPTGDEEGLAPGMIIRSFLPSSSSTGSQSDNSTSLAATPLPVSATSSTSSTDTLSHPKRSNTIPVTLRLTRPLGQGSFSSVWLAEDLSPTSLLLRSRRSLRDLKRKASAGASLSTHTGSLVRKASEKKPKALSSTSNLMRKLRGGVSGTRPQVAKKAADIPPVPPLPHYLVPGGLPPMLSPSSLEFGHDVGDAKRLTMNSYLGEPGVSLSRASSVSGRSDVETEDEEGTEGVIRKASVKSVRSIGSVSRSGSERSVRSSRSGKLGNNRGRLVAVKLTSRGVVERKDKDKNRLRTPQEIEEERERDRTRVSFVREVEVLKRARSCRRGRQF
ncbi:hypothetical protein D9758_001471 [Tetrapyrgos nigripes]|uniref:Uncharacterized protein n=1 Tax=Tetrapyrgos nigripes TaxID=182062 RepID=A0A8H5GY24_9AGAR|nr:hypothetical protein D9758_001471 [Tetrapyrgos nigripes]